MSWLAFVLAFQIGWIPQGGVASYAPPDYVDSSSMFYQMAEVKAILFNTVEVGGSLKVQDWLSRGSGIGFFPNQLDSVFYADVLLGPAKIGWIHECIHPVVPYQPLNGVMPAWDGWKDEIYARVELRW